VGIEPNAMIGQLVKTRTPIGCGTTDISDTKKAHAQPVAGEFDAHMHAWDRKEKKIQKILRECSDMILSVAA